MEFPLGWRDLLPLCFFFLAQDTAETRLLRKKSGWCWADIQQGRGESASCAARQDVAPPPSPSSLRACLQDEWHLPGSGLGKSTQKLNHLPPTSAPRTTRRALSPSPADLQARTFLPSSSLLQSCTIHGRCSGSRCAIAAHRGDTIVVSMASCAPCHCVKPSATSSLRPSNLLCCARPRSRTNTLVDTRTPASRQTWGTLQQQPPSPQNSCLCACCSMVSNYVKWAATSAGA